MLPPVRFEILGDTTNTTSKSETVQLLRSDPATSEEEHIRIMLAQTEIERVKFIVRSYVRTRLFKVRPNLRIYS